MIFLLTNPRSRVILRLSVGIENETSTEERMMTNQIQIIDWRVTCTSCDRWEWESSGKSIRHNPNRCADPTAQLGRPAVSQTDSRTKPGAFSKDSPASGLTRDEINEALYRREISESDAMNTDF